jgi:polysaccharide biosynthesis protein PslJ
MLFLVPFDAMQVKVSLPVDSTPDRFYMGLLAVVFLAALATRAGLHDAKRPLLLYVAIGCFVAVAVASVLLNLDVLVKLGQDGLAVKKLALLCSYAAFFLIVARTIRPTELENFGILLIGLACITAIGTVWEYRTNVNWFYDLAQSIFSPIAHVNPPPADPKFGRPSTVGPGAHGLTVTTMMALVLPFALIGVMGSKSRSRRLFYSAATALILAGALATLRKTGAVAPAAALLGLVLYRPRQMVRLLPLGVAVIAAIQVIAPGAAVNVKAQFIGGNLFDRNTTTGRTDDYTAVRPDVLTYPLVGRGYGTYDPRVYRILDNDYLGTLIEVGILGMVAFLAIFVAGLATAHPVIRRGDPTRAPPALAASAAVMAFAVATFLFDILSFPQAPYLLFFILGLATVAASTPVRSTIPRRA